MIITHTLKVGGKGYKQGVSQAGKPWQLESFKAYPFEEYVSVMLPEWVHQGDVVTVSGTVKKEENGQYLNYTLQFPVIDRMYQAENAHQTQGDPFAGQGQAVSINDDELPF